jgi:hypothetical protein
MSHCDRILDALRDGKWHTSADLYDAVGGYMVLHSRISDLRKKGHNVEGRHVPGRTGADGYEYRLASSVDEPSEPQYTRAVEASPLALPPAEQLFLSVAPSHYDI